MTSYEDYGSGYLEKPRAETYVGYSSQEYHQG